MKTTYTRTLFCRNLSEAEVTIRIYNELKWEAYECTAKVSYTGVTSWDIIEGGKEAEEIEAETDASSIDEFHTYLVLHFQDGSTSTFRNSHVDMILF